VFDSCRAHFDRAVATPLRSNALQVAPQSADPDHDLLEPSAFEAAAALVAAPPIPVDRTEDSRSKIVSVSSATVYTASALCARPPLDTSNSLRHRPTEYPSRAALLRIAGGTPG
jgi:hypothetical protein